MKGNEAQRQKISGAGLLFVDKTRGISSHDVVAITRKYTREKVGHCGTLDPFATGLLILCIGKATKHTQEITTLDKHYQGVILLGESRDTDDVTGSLIARGPIPELTLDLREQAVKDFTGTQKQTPPQYSAIKIRGQRAYKLARAGKRAILPQRQISIHYLHLNQINPGRIHLRVHCSKGTYIRALARDIGIYLGTYGHLESLRRTGIGDIDMDKEVMHQRLIPELITSDFIPLEAFFRKYIQ